MEATTQEVENEATKIEDPEVVKQYLTDEAPEKLIEKLKDMQAKHAALTKRLESISEKVENPEAHNNRVRTMYSTLAKAGIGEAAIAAALKAEFGSAKARKPRKPNRTDFTPTAQELAVLRTLDEPMNRQEVLTKCQIPNDDTTKDLFPDMARAGWIENTGGRAAAARWQLTEKGRKTAEDHPTTASN